ncbi:hypothetical protein ASF12_23560 [Paenibacillus sp. Leaf72]|nr:hypothetical protein ASF12_23560 [Paenibacillus sp. Leaf72]
MAYKEVVGLFQKQADEIYYVHIGDEIIEVTGEHPFWLDGKGWTFVKDLKVGDLLVSSDGTKLAIDKIEKESREATVYNFEVEDFNSYFVSNLGIWVHNCEVNWSAGNFVSGKLDKHFQKHVVKKQEWADLGFSLTKEGYLNRAKNLLNSNIGGDIHGFTSKNGYVFRYNSKTNEFATAKPDGTIETLFRPDDGMSYWKDQVTTYGGN